MDDMSGEELDARLDLRETRMDKSTSSIERTIIAKFAELEAVLHESRVNTIKSVAGWPWPRARLEWL